MSETLVRLRELSQLAHRIDRSLERRRDFNTPDLVLPLDEALSHSGRLCAWLDDMVASVEIDLELKPRRRRTK